MNLAVQVEGFPYALRVIVPQEHAALLEEWLNATEECNLLQQQSLSFGRLNPDDKQTIKEAKANHHKSYEASERVADIQKQVFTWLKPLLSDAGFDFFTDNDISVSFEHETIWRRQNPETPIYNLESLDNELPRLELGDTVQDLREMLRHFPPKWVPVGYGDYFLCFPTKEQAQELMQSINPIIYSSIRLTTLDDSLH